MQRVLWTRWWTDETGYVVGKTDGPAFGEALVRLVNDPDLRAALGKAGRRRVESDFDRRRVWEGMYREYVGNSSEHAVREGSDSHGS